MSQGPKRYLSESWNLVRFEPGARRTEGRSSWMRKWRDLARSVQCQGTRLERRRLRRPTLTRGHHQNIFHSQLNSSSIGPVMIAKRLYAKFVFVQIEELLSTRGVRLLSP